MIRVFINRSFFAAKKTQLYDMHIAKKGKMVEFAGNAFFIKDIKCLSNIPQGSSRSISTADNTHQFLMYRTWAKSTSQALTESNCWRESQ
jgi:hypothetical protein